MTDAIAIACAIYTGISLAGHVVRWIDRRVFVRWLDAALDQSHRYGRRDW